MAIVTGLRIECGSVALFKEIFKEHFMVRAVLISWRPFHKAVAEPHLTFQSSYYRLIINGDVKDWKINPTEDMREMSHSQIHEALDEDNWMVTIFGHDFAEEGASSSAICPRFEAENKTT